MSYSVNGKVYTSHPLMDEIVYHCKNILAGIVLKNEKKANEFETADSLSESDAFLAIMNGSIHLEILPITETFLMMHGFSEYDSYQLARDIHKLPKYTECTLKRYNEKNNAPVKWNAMYARYEYVGGSTAGWNQNQEAILDEENKRFVRKDGTECTGYIIPLKESYYTDQNGNIIVPEDPDDPDNTTFRDLLTGEVVHRKPIECRAGIFNEFANDYYHDETNLYYRTLEGLPVYGTTDYDVYINYGDYEYLFDQDDTTEYNFELPIHEYSTSQINALSTLGILDDIIDTYYTNAESNNKPYYRYLNYLGMKKIDLYTARIAKEWDILYMPATEHIIADTFKEKFKINRDIYYRRTYQQAYSIYSDYYEEMIMILILCQTFTDMITDTPEFYIRRDIFDLRSVQYFLEANGVEFYKEIPLKYQILIVKNLNKLIKYKSTEKNIDDILNIFSMEDAIVYKYYLYKKYLYNRFEQAELEEDSGDMVIEDEDGSGWQDSGLIINGDFATGNTKYWQVSRDFPGYTDIYECGDEDEIEGIINDFDEDELWYQSEDTDVIQDEDTEDLDFYDESDPAYDKDKDADMDQDEDIWKSDFGYKIAVDKFSKQNTTPYLYIWNKTTEEKSFFLRQTIPNVDIGYYRIRYRCAGTKGKNLGLRVYVNEYLVMTSPGTYGDSKNEWRYVHSEPFEVNPMQTITVDIQGKIPAEYSGRIDDIMILEQTDIWDCGDEEEVEGIHSSDPDWELVDFIDETEDDNYTKNYIYDFGNEDGEYINPGRITDVELDYKESTRTIYDEVGNVYELEFVKVPLGESYDDYIKNNIYRDDYDDLTMEDPYWDGEDVHNYVKNNHLKKEFTIEGSKYMSLELDIPYQEYSYQRQYYIGLLMNNNLDTEDLAIAVPSIKQNATFTLQNLFLFIYCCNGIYDETEPVITDPTGLFIRDKSKPDFEPFEIIDGGHAWDGENVEDEEEEEVSEDIPDLDFGDEDLDSDFEGTDDFGDEDDPNNIGCEEDEYANDYGFIYAGDERTPTKSEIHDYNIVSNSTKRIEISKTDIVELYDFGYNIMIDYDDPNLVVYDYGEIRALDIDTESDLEKEINEPPLWPIRDLADYGDDDLREDEEDSQAVIRSDYTKTQDFGDEDNPIYYRDEGDAELWDFGGYNQTVDYNDKNLQVYDYTDEDEIIDFGDMDIPDLDFGDEARTEDEDEFPFIYDYSAETAASVLDINISGFDGRVYEFGDEDLGGTTLVEDKYSEVYDFGFESPNSYNRYNGTKIYTFDFGFENPFLVEEDEELIINDSGDEDDEVPIVSIGNMEYLDEDNSEEYEDVDEEVLDYGVLNPFTIEYTDPEIYEAGDEDDESVEITTDDMEYRDEDEEEDVDNPEDNETNTLDFLYEEPFITEDPDPFTNGYTDDYYVPYYIQNNDLSMLKLYEYNPNTQAYELVHDYSDAIIPAEFFDYDIKIILTRQNYKIYLNHFIVNRIDGSITKLTLDNYEEYLGKELLLFYPWHYEKRHRYTLVLDGHHTNWDEDRDDVIYDKNTNTWYKLNGKIAHGEITLQESKYRIVYDGGPTRYTLDDTELMYYDWLRSNNRNLWTEPTGRVLGFNMFADLNEIGEAIGIRHSNFGWEHGYTLADCGVDNFICQTKFTSIQDLYETYTTNTECYYNLIEKMENASTRDEAQIYSYVYYQLFTIPYDAGLYVLRTGELADTYDQILAERDYTLYSYFLRIMDENDADVRRELVREILNELTDTLSYYISGDNLKYVLSVISTNSTDAILHYISLIINFFKSWKVYFLDPHNTYILNDKFNHMAFTGDTLNEVKPSDYYVDKFANRDAVQIKVTYTAQETKDHTKEANMNHTAEVVDVYSHYVEENIIADRVFDGQYEDENDESIEVLDGGSGEDYNKPFYVIDGGETAARHPSYEIEGGGAGLLNKDEYKEGVKENPDIKYVNLPTPQDEDNYAIIDGKPQNLTDKPGAIVDGGPSDVRTYRTKTITTIVDDRNYLTMDVRISPRQYNGMTIESDGLYCKDDFADQTSMDVLYSDIKDLRSSATTQCQELIDTLYAYGTLEGLDKTVHRSFADYFRGFEYSYTALSSNTTAYEKNLKDTVDDKVGDFKEWFTNINPFNSYTKL